MRDRTGPSRITDYASRTTSAGHHSMAEWAEWVWLNGRMVTGADASVSVFDRSFQLGDGVFETMRAQRGCIFRLHRHLTRLREGMVLFGISSHWDNQTLYF